MFAVICKCKNNIPVDIKLDLFDRLTVMLYAYNTGKAAPEIP